MQWNHPVGRNCSWRTWCEFKQLQYGKDQIVDGGKATGNVAATFTSSAPISFLQAYKECPISHKG